MAEPAGVLQLNPVSPENLLDPVPLYRELRSNDPVHWSDLLNAWLIFRYDDVMNCFRDSRLTGDRTKLFEFQLQGLSPDLISSFTASLRNQMGMKDGPEHLRLRRQANPGFTPQSIDSWLPSIRRTMNMLVDRVLPLGRIDFAQEFSDQYPTLVIAELFGVPVEDRERFQKWNEPLADLASPPPGTDMKELAGRANVSAREFGAYLSDLIEERRRNPRHDVLSLMIHAQEEGKLTHEELVANALLIISAGHKTTTDLLSNAIYELWTRPEQLRMLREDRSLMSSALEEILRFRPPLPFFVRIASETFALRGRTIRAGDVVFLGIASANRDPLAFSPEPDLFDITRDSSNQKLLSFGFGAHHCLGSGLARREIEIALDVLLDRLPGLRLDEENPPKVKASSLFFRGFDSLPVRW
jgi:cytochrome P450